jgi:hypothetical protein
MHPDNALTIFWRMQEISALAGSNVMYQFPHVCVAMKFENVTATSSMTSDIVNAP